MIFLKASPVAKTCNYRAACLIVFLLLGAWTDRLSARPLMADEGEPDMAVVFVTSGPLAKPMLHLLESPVLDRTTPAAFTVENYHGRIKWGDETIRFVAPGGEVRREAWTDPEYIAIARAAVELVEERAVGSDVCNRYFAELMPGAKTFAEIWRATGRERIRISFSPGPSGIWRAATYPQAPFEWTITENAVRLGPESTASAIVHEATRTNGIGPEIEVAFGAAKACGMRYFLLTEDVIQQLGWPSMVN